MRPVYAYLGAAVEASSNDDRVAIVQKSGVRHARFGTFAACIGTLAVGDVLDRHWAAGPKGTVGLVASGGPSHVDIALEFCTKYFTSGPRLVNPLMFPATLFSSAATAIAATIGAHGFALTIGADGLASADALRIAMTMTRAGHADPTVVVALCSTGMAIVRCEREAHANGNRVDIAMAIGLTCRPHSKWDFKFHSSCVESGKEIERMAPRASATAIGVSPDRDANWRELAVERYHGAAFLLALPDLIRTAGMRAGSRELVVIAEAKQRRVSFRVAFPSRPEWYRK